MFVQCVIYVNDICISLTYVGKKYVYIQVSCLSEIALGFPHFILYSYDDAINYLLFFFLRQWGFAHPIQISICSDGSNYNVPCSQHALSDSEKVGSEITEQI